MTLPSILQQRVALALVALSVCVFCLCVSVWQPQLLTSVAARIGIVSSALQLGLLVGCVVSMLILAWLVLYRILRPLRYLVHQLGGPQPGSEASAALQGADEIQWVHRRALRLREKMQRTESLLEESTETLRHTEKLALVGKLAAGVAHSIRNPLTGVKMRIFSLARGLELNERQEEDLHAINDAIKHMESIASNFLDFSRRPTLRKSPTDIAQVVDSTLSLLKSRLESFQVQVEIHKPDSMPLVDADAEQLREALVNLIINACEAMGVGGELTITEESGQLAPLGKVVVLRVTDSGPGIPDDMQKVIFQPFISTKAEGTGLGLPIAMRIFEEHGGWLHLHNTPGCGATFVAVLPARMDEDLWTRS